MIICLTRSTVKNVHNFRPLFLVLFFCVYLLFFWSLSPHFAAKAFLSFFFFFFNDLVCFISFFPNDLACFFSFFPTNWHVFSFSLGSIHSRLCLKEWQNLFHVYVLVRCLWVIFFLFLSFILRLRMELNHTIKIKSMF